jgi:uncharacterized protein YaeQ
MALGATVIKLKIQLSDSDRAVYETLELRLAQHPSETPSYLVTRALAYALLYEEGIAFSHGLSNADEPALWIKTPDGRTLAWIEVGSPSAERLHRASKACSRVVVFCHHDVELLLRELARGTIHRGEQLEIYAPDAALITFLAERLERNMSWELVRSGGHLYVTIDGKTGEGALTRRYLESD